MAWKDDVREAIEKGEMLGDRQSEGYPVVTDGIRYRRWRARYSLAGKVSVVEWKFPWMMERDICVREGIDALPWNDSQYWSDLVVEK